MDTQNMMGEDFTPSTVPTSDEKTIAILSHVLGFFTSFIGPLVIYLVKKDESEFIAAHAKESLNFQLTVFIGYFVSFILMIILIGVLLACVLSLVNLVLIIVATIRASEGRLYKYPFSLKLIK